MQERAKPRRPVMALVCAVVLLGGAHVPRSGPASVGVATLRGSVEAASAEDPAWRKVDALVKAHAKLDMFSGTVLVARRGEVIYEAAVGEADKDHRVPNRADMRFNVGSIGKTFTAVSIMQLVQNGRLQLTDTLDKFLPECPFPEKATITIEHLLAHSSGLGDYPMHPDYRSKMVTRRTEGKRLPEATVLEDLQKPHQIVVDGNDLYIFDEADYSVHVYTLAPFAPKLTFGRKGDGPHDFKYLPFLFAQPDSLACTDFTKIVRFSRKGEALRAAPFSDFKDFDVNSEMLLVPMGDRFLRITGDHGKFKRFVDLVDSNLQFVRTLYEGPFVWMQGSRTDFRTDTVVSGGLAFIADTFKGFSISVFDSKGTLLRTIDRNADVEEVRDRARLHQFSVSDGRIYATTYKKVDGKTEMIVLDLEGRIVRRLYLPLASIRPGRGPLRFDLFTVARGKLYELVQKDGKGPWELVVTDLAGVR